MPDSSERANDLNPSVSVVIIGRNEGDRLVRCIQSVLGMQYDGKTEIIYVDSDSVDGSPERATELGARVVNVKPERPCAAVGRNAGWREALGDVVFFLDGDTIVEPDFVAHAIREFQDEKVGVVWGHRREIQTRESVFNRVLDLDWVYPPGPSDFCGGDALFLRSVLEITEGYNEELIAGEEPELCQRIRQRGYVIQHVDLPMTGHDLAMTRWSQYWRRATRAGYAYAEISNKLKDTEFPLWVDDARRNRLRGSIVLATPILTAAACFVIPSFLPLAVVFAGATLLAARTAIRTRWKGGSFTTRFLYGLHSHVQQVPILFGQISYYRHASRGTKRKLIEYKEVVN
ncbi:MAG: glycosyltransferase family 2 protein [Planctomycetota bacterium]